MKDSQRRFENFIVKSNPSPYINNEILSYQRDLHARQAQAMLIQNTSETQGWTTYLSREDAKYPSYPNLILR